MPEEWTQEDYWDTVRTIAEEAADLTTRDDRDWFVTESVDGDSYIIYDRGHEIVLSASPNEPDPDEAKAMVDEDADWRKIRMIAAFMAMEADVWSAVKEIERDPLYEVQVGNIGRVYRGRDEDEAKRIFSEYVTQSRAGTGRAGGESVTLFEDDDPIEEYFLEDEEPAWRRWKP